MNFLRLIFIPMVSLFLAISFTVSLSGQELDIIETKSLEKDEGLKARSIGHTIRDDKGYFYFFSDHTIQRYDGELFEDVDIGLLQNLSEKLIDIASLSRNEDGIWIRFRSNKQAILAHGGLDLVAVNSNQEFPINVRVDNQDLRLDELEITTGNKRYQWRSGKLLISDGQSTEEILIPSSGNPKFIRLDGKGNIIAAYTSRRRYIDNIYVLDTDEQLHDFTEVARAYETARDLYTDDAFYKWMLSGYHGVKVITLKRKGVEFLLQKPNIPQGQFGELMTGVSASDSIVLLSTERGFLHTYYSDSLVYFDKDYGFISSGLGKQIFDRNRNKFILKGFDGDLTDLYFIDQSNFESESHQLEGAYRDFILNKDGNLVLAGISPIGKGMLLIYNPDTKAKQYPKIELPEIRTVFQNTKTDEYYVGTKGGLYVFDHQFALIAKYGQDQHRDRHLFYDDILCTYHYNNHLIACSNGGGVYIIDLLKGKVVKHLNEKNGFSDAVAISTITDDSNRLWIGTFNGINVIDTTFSVIKKLYEFDGLPNREFNSFAATKNNGQLYFGTINGVAKIDPDLVLGWEKSYHIDLEKVTVHKGSSASEVLIDSSNIEIVAPDSISINYRVTDLSLIHI